MKKLFITVMALIGLASAQPIAKDLINRFLTFSVEEVIGDTVFDDVWGYVSRNDFTTSTYTVYHSGRSNLYENLGLKFDGWETYIQGRTIIVARVKEHFRTGDNLKKFFMHIQPKFRVEVAKLSLKQKQSLFLRLTAVKESFEMMLASERQALHKAWMHEEQYPERKWDEAEKMLASNMSAADIVKKIEGGALQMTGEAKPTKEDLFLEGFADPEIGKFAARRFREGGSKLLNKYIEVIQLALDDVK